MSMMILAACISYPSFPAAARREGSLHARRLRRGEAVQWGVGGARDLCDREKWAAQAGQIMPIDRSAEEQSTVVEYSRETVWSRQRKWHYRYDNVLQHGPVWESAKHLG